MMNVNEKKIIDLSHDKIKKRIKDLVEILPSKKYIYGMFNFLDKFIGYIRYPRIEFDHFHR